MRVPLGFEGDGKIMRRKAISLLLVLLLGVPSGCTGDADFGVSGLVLDAGGKPVVGAEATLEPTEDSDLAPEYFSGGTTKTGEDGTFAFGVVYDAYRVHNPTVVLTIRKPGLKSVTKRYENISVHYNDKFKMSSE